MNNDRMKELLRIAVDHIESFEEEEAQNVFKSLGFTENELKEIFYGDLLTEKELKNIGMVDRSIIHNGQIVWQLSDTGEEYIFSDANCVPFERFPHYFYINEKSSNPSYIGFAWYSENEYYEEHFNSLDECLDWLVEEPELETMQGQEIENRIFDNEVINIWVDELLKNSNKESFNALTLNDLATEIEEVEGALSNERLWNRVDNTHEENVTALTEYLDLLQNQFSTRVANLKQRVELADACLKRGDLDKFCVKGWEEERRICTLEFSELYESKAVNNRFKSTSSLETLINSASDSVSELNKIGIKKARKQPFER